MLGKYEESDPSLNWPAKLKDYTFKQLCEMARFYKTLEKARIGLTKKTGRKKKFQGYEIQLHFRRFAVKYKIDEICFEEMSKKTPEEVLKYKFLNETSEKAKLKYYIDASKIQESICKSSFLCDAAAWVGMSGNALVNYIERRYRKTFSELKKEWLVNTTPAWDCKLQNNTLKQLHEMALHYKTIKEAVKGLGVKSAVIHKCFAKYAIKFGEKDINFNSMAETKKDFAESEYKEFYNKKCNEIRIDLKNVDFKKILFFIKGKKLTNAASFLGVKSDTLKKHLSLVNKNIKFCEENKGIDPSNINFAFLSKLNNESEINKYIKTINSLNLKPIDLNKLEKEEIDKAIKESNTLYSAANLLGVSVDKLKVYIRKTKKTNSATITNEETGSGGIIKPNNLEKEKLFRKRKRKRKSKRPTDPSKLIHENGQTQTSLKRRKTAQPHFDFFASPKNRSEVGKKNGYRTTTESMS